MTELDRRLNALYLVVDASVADDIKKHVDAEIDKLRNQVKAFEDALEHYSDAELLNPGVRLNLAGRVLAEYKSHASQAQSLSEEK